MTVYLSKFPLTYVSVPKCACTSLKKFFFEIENGFPFRRCRLNGQDYDVHRMAKSVPFGALRTQMMHGHARIAVVRDPVGRVVSCYSNKVRNGRLLKRPKTAMALKERGLNPHPDIHRFIAELPEYQRVSADIQHHSEPLSHFLGTDPAFFDRLFALRDLPQLVAFVGGIVGPVPDLPHTQKSASSRDASALTEADRRRIETMFAEDLEIFGGFM